jgi:Cu2+-exporting ATPase
MIKTYNIEGLSCASCATSAQKILSKIDGIQSVRVNYASFTAVVKSEYEIELSVLNEKLGRVGYSLYPKNKEAQLKHQEIEQAKIKALKLELIIAAIFALPLFVIAMFLHGQIQHQLASYLMLFLSLPIVLYSGSRFFVSAWKQLLMGKSNMDSLVALGTGTAFLFSLFNTIFPHYLMRQGIEAQVYYESAGLLIFFILLGKFFEQNAKKKTTAAVQSLLSLNVQELTVLINGIEKKIPVEAALPDDIVIVKPGDKIPLDGIILSGNSEIDESMLSGEPLPKFKKTGDIVFAGTINLNGYFHFKVTKTSDDTILAQMIRLVEAAQNDQAPIQKRVDLISSYFVPAVILLSILTATIWLLVGPEPRLTYAIISAVSVLVISCPCALGLATPTAIMVGIGRAAQKGILIKTAESLQFAARIDAILFDKTGTLTEGKPSVNSLKVFDDNPQNLLILASLEQSSEHPLSKAICQYLNSNEDKLALSNFENISGRGVKAVFSDQYYFAGNLNWMNENKISANEEQLKYLSELNETGDSLVFFANSTAILAIISLSDTIKSTSHKAIQSLKSKGLDVYMLTGDRSAAAKKIADELGIDNFVADLLPADKIDFVKKLQQSGKKVAMVGDGINDAPALAAANLGIGMNSGTNIAVESADIVLLNNNLMQISEMLHISKRTMSILNQNLFWAFFYNVLAIPIAAGLLYPVFGMLLDPMIAGAAMAFSSVSVVLNSLRI